MQSLINVDVDLLFWLRSGSDVDLARGNIMDGHSFRKESSNVLLLDAGHHHAGAALLPVHRGGHLLGGGELEAVDHSDDLVKVTAGGGGVEQRQLQPLVRTDDEDSSGSQGNSLGVLLIWVHHPVHLGNISLGVGNDGVGELREVVVGLDVINPADVGLHLVTGEGDQLDAPLGELPAEFLHAAQLGGADRGEVGRVGEEDGPAISQPGVEVNLALVGLGGEVWHDVSE